MTVTINGTFGIVGPNGSASTPAMTGTDTDSGIVYGTNTVQIATGGTTAVTVDSSQNVGIGTASPWSQISSYGTSGATTQYLGFKNADGGDIRFGKASGVDNTCIIGTWGGNRIKFYTNSTNVMDIDTSGNLLLNTTSTTGTACMHIPATSSKYSIAFRSSSTTGSACAFFNSSGGGVGEILINASSTTYATSSDYRLKENIAPMTGALATVSALKPVTYTWKSTGEASQGFIAHELQAIVPECVTGEKDAVETYIDEDGNEQTRPVYQGIDTSFLVATLTAAIQELKAELDAVKTELATLKG